MTRRRCPTTEGALDRGGARRRCSSAASAPDALVLGPGLGRARAAVDVRARRSRRRAGCRCVLDADGLNAHAGTRSSRWPGAPPPTVLTPHAGELGAAARQLPSAEIGAHRLWQRAPRRPRAARAIVVLKGDDTIVADPDGRVAVSRGGAPALATAGTGDVLVRRDRRATWPRAGPVRRRLRRRARRTRRRVALAAGRDRRRGRDRERRDRGAAARAARAPARGPE